MERLINFVKNIFNTKQTNNNLISFEKNIQQSKPHLSSTAHIENKAISDRIINIDDIKQTWGSKPGEINGKKLKQAMFCSSDIKSLQSQNVNNILDKLFLPSKEEIAINFYCENDENLNKLISVINGSIKRNLNFLTLKIDLENGIKNDLTIDLKTLKHVLNLIDNNMPVFVKLDERSTQVNPDNNYIKNFYDKTI